MGGLSKTLSLDFVYRSTLQGRILVNKWRVKDVLLQELKCRIVVKCR